MSAPTKRGTDNSRRNLPPSQREALLEALQTRFKANMGRHPGCQWETVRLRLESRPDKFSIINEMERTGGEPDVLGRDESTGEFLFCDCSAESPLGRRSLCYDAEALATRKQNKPAGSALDMARTMGVDILNEEQYRELQKSGEFDTKTSSWIWTPPAIRNLGGALFCDRRYGTVFVYHNGAESYFAARGFRGILRI
ncbi:MAG TPA: DUF4256 domain-containing protein [Bryobacteraceae bacterium]|nr:DUF4256 domain-containing protein [Bryobacteraceae bacterium]